MKKEPTHPKIEVDRIDTASYDPRVAPTNDLWIAALALQHSAALFTFDRHFALVDGLIVGINTAALEL